ncbi:hypothetical protein ACWEPR_25940 [Streptomyces sp. NPDC004290]
MAEVEAAAGSVPMEQGQCPFHRVGLVYSVAAPRPADLDTGITCASVLKPIGRANRTKTLVFDGEGVPEVREVETGAAEGDYVEQTLSVMGGLVWERWMDHLAARILLAEGFATVALSCIGSPLTAAIYHQGHHRRGQGPSGGDCPQPERSAGQGSGRAVTSVNGAAVTQSSTEAPGIALYTGLLRGVLVGGGPRPAGPSDRRSVGPGHRRRPARPG